MIAQLGEHCTGVAEVVGSNPAQSLKIFSDLCSSSVTAALALMTVITQLLLWDKLLSSRDSRLFNVAQTDSFCRVGTKPLSEFYIILHSFGIKQNQRKSNYYRVILLLSTDLDLLLGFLSVVNAFLRRFQLELCVHNSSQIYVECGILIISIYSSIVT